MTQHTNVISESKTHVNLRHTIVVAIVAAVAQRTEQSHVVSVLRTRMPTIRDRIFSQVYKFSPNYYQLYTNIS